MYQYTTLAGVDDSVEVSVCVWCFDVILPCGRPCGQMNTTLVHALYATVQVSLFRCDVVTTSLLLCSADVTVDCAFAARAEQVNSLTPWVDASQVYGNSLEEAEALRDHTDPLVFGRGER